MKPRKIHHSRGSLMPGVQSCWQLAFACGFGLGLCLFGVFTAFAVWGPKYNFIEKIFSAQEIAKYKENIARLETQSILLQEEILRNNELAKLDKETRGQLTLLIGNLESENARLKEDLAFFEGFIPSNLQSAISLKRLQVNPDTVPDQYSYKALVIQGNQRPEVTLNVQVLIKVLNNGQSSVIVLPSDGAKDNPQFKIKLTRFSRVSGVFSIPQGSKPQSVEMRILESGAIRAQSIIKL